MERKAINDKINLKQNQINKLNEQKQELQQQEQQKIKEIETLKKKIRDENNLY